MNYELAKKLKDAGFPQNPDNPQVHTAACGNFVNTDPECRSENRGVAPTLEELIEAVGAKNLKLSADFEGEWAVYSYVNACGAIGSTAVEATANLWLALNKVQ